MLTTFIVLNIVVGIVLNSISDSSKEVPDECKKRDIDVEFKKLKEQLEIVERILLGNKNKKE